MWKYEISYARFFFHRPCFSPVYNNLQQQYTSEPRHLSPPPHVCGADSATRGGTVSTGTANKKLTKLYWQWSVQFGQFLVCHPLSNSVRRHWLNAYYCSCLTEGLGLGILVPGWLVLMRTYLYSYPLSLSLSRPVICGSPAWLWPVRANSRVSRWLRR